jgi:putative intracellular protease/amidase
LKKYSKFILLFLSLLTFTSCLFTTPVNAYMPGHKVMILAANSVGDTYFPAKRYFQFWGWKVTTAGLTPSVTSCLNTNPRPVPVDIVISEITENILAEYDCVFIPSGGHWSALLNDATTLTLISDAYNLGLIISSLCVGIRVLAGADIVDGVRIAYDSNSATQVTAAGGITVDARVVTDQRIVTGTTGGGFTGGGASLAPTLEVCEAITILISLRSLPLSIAVIGITGAALVGLILFMKRKNR